MKQYLNKIVRSLNSKEKAKLIPINYYAKTKIKIEKIIKENFKDSRHSTKILRPFTVLAPMEDLICQFLSFLKI